MLRATLHYATGITRTTPIKHPTHLFNQILNKTNAIGNYGANAIPSSIMHTCW